MRSGSRIGLALLLTPVLGFTACEGQYGQLPPLTEYERNFATCRELALDVTRTLAFRASVQGRPPGSGAFAQWSGASGAHEAALESAEVRHNALVGTQRIHACPANPFRVGD